MLQYSIGKESGVPRKPSRTRSSRAVQYGFSQTAECRIIETNKVNEGRWLY